MRLASRLLLLLAVAVAGLVASEAPLTGPAARAPGQGEVEPEADELSHHDHDHLDISKAAADWTVDEAAVWARDTLHCPVCADNFRKHGIDGYLLLRLSASDVRQLVPDTDEDDDDEEEEEEGEKKRAERRAETASPRPEGPAAVQERLRQMRELAAHQAHAQAHAHSHGDHHHHHDDEEEEDEDHGTREPDFWAYLRAFPQRTWLLSSAASNWPLVAVLVAALHPTLNREVLVSLRGGVLLDPGFWLAAVLAPRLLMVWWALPFFRVNFFITLAFCVTQLAAFWKERAHPLSFAKGLPKNRWGVLALVASPLLSLAGAYLIPSWLQRLWFSASVFTSVMGTAWATLLVVAGPFVKLAFK